MKIWWKKLPQVVILLAFLLILPVLALADTIVSSKVSGDIPLDPAWKGWTNAKPVTLPISPQKIAKPYNENPAIKQVTVRSLHNGKNIAFALEWKDSSKDSLPKEVSFSDACAIQIPIKNDSTTPFYMGETKKPVMLLHWKAVWGEGVVDVQKLYPNVQADWYPNGDKGFSTTEGWKHGKRYLAGYAADNPISTPTHPNGAEELLAEGFGTLTTSPNQNTKGKAIRTKDGWKVVLVRPFKGEGENNPDWAPGKTTIVNFAVWDGSKQERGSRKGIIQEWQTLQIQP